MNHHQCDIHMHPAAYLHGPVLITYLRDILAVGFWLGDLAASTPRSVDCCWFFHGHPWFPPVLPTARDCAACHWPPRLPLQPITSRAGTRTSSYVTA